MTHPLPVWTESFRVRSYEVDATGLATVPALCNLLQEAADRHAVSYGVAVDQILAAHAETWVLYRLALRVHRAPRWRDEVTVETWPCGRERLFTVREYRVLDREGALLAEGASAWLVMDPVARRLVRHPKTRVDWRAERGRAWPEAFGEKIPAVAGDARERALSVRRGEIDVNGHVNHVHFIAWALEAVDEARWSTGRVASFDVEYQAEALPGDVVVARASPDDGGLRWRHEVVRPADGRVLIRAQSTWAPNPQTNS